MRTGDLWVAMGGRHVRHAPTGATFRAAAPPIYMFGEYSIVETDNHPWGIALNHNSRPRESLAHSALSHTLAPSHSLRAGKLPTTENRSSGPAQPATHRHRPTDDTRTPQTDEFPPRHCAPIGQCTLQSRHVRLVWCSVREPLRSRVVRVARAACRVRVPCLPRRTENNTSKQR